MKAIETVYNGYRFRSRLEARWAVFFDAVKLPYSYETEGYELEGYRYLPDFFIPDWDAFVEIKGKKPTIDERRKCEALAEASHKPVLLVYGEPWPNQYKALLYWTEDDIPSGDFLGTEGVFMQCRRCDCICFALEDEPGIAYFSLSLGHHDEGKNCEDRWPLVDGLEHAFTEARQARFEKT